MADNRLFLCSSVSSALLLWPRCAITANRLFLCSSVSSALLSWPRCAITANRLFLCSSAVSARLSPAHIVPCRQSCYFFVLLFLPLFCPGRCAIVGQSAVFLLQFQHSPFTFLIASRLLAVL
ncbi:hypothetical protein AVEN_224640-1 [Araneus ventricosus]|uniref:Uncharacterized protein n=1 Tax=Araneus ventricosus TaxID=182803 RepID=A0A4Y2Q9T4_ARAVE|nr:hypothetical protein AVEN_224640-1 [Araneus ventricosus]